MFKKKLRGKAMKKVNKLFIGVIFTMLFLGFCVSHKEVKAEDNNGNITREIEMPQHMDKKLSLHYFKINPGGEVTIDNPVNISAQATGGVGEYQYCFYVIRNDKKIILQSFSNNNECVWMPYTPAEYKVCVEVRDQIGNIVTGNINYKINYKYLSIKSFEVNPKGAVEQRDKVVLNAETISEAGGVEYSFYVVRGGVKIQLQPFSSKSTCVWIPSTIGKYQVFVEAKDKYGTIITEQQEYEVKKSSLTINKFNVSPEEKNIKNQEVILEVEASGGRGEYTYCFYAIRGKKKIVLKDFGKENICTWKPFTPANYDIYTVVRDENGNEMMSKKKFSVKNSFLQIDDFQVAPKVESEALQKIALTATTSLGIGKVEYCFYVVRDGKKIQLQEYSESSSCVWVPFTPAKYEVYVEAKDSSGSVVTKKIEHKVNPQPLKINRFEVGSQVYSGEKVKLEIQNEGGVYPYSYQYYVIRNGNVDDKILLQDFSFENSYTWTPVTPAIYEIIAVLKDSYGQMVEERKSIIVSPATLEIKEFHVGNSQYAQSSQRTPVSVDIETKGNVGQLQYKYYVQRNNEEILLQDFSTKRHLIWRPFTPAKYEVYVEVLDQNGNIYRKQKDFEVIEQRLFIKNFTMNVQGSVFPNTNVKLAASSMGATGNCEYKFYVIRNGAEIVIQDYSAKTSCIWKPFTTAIYDVCVSARDESGLETSESKILKVAGKNGWYYELGYKFYYKNGVKQVDLDGILPWQSSYYIKVNRTTCSVTVYAKDGANGYIIPVKRFACSVGLPSTPTPTGTYYTPAKYRWHTLMGPSYGQYCTRIVGGILFHSVAGYNMTSYNIRAKDYNKLGQPASHGCVRLNVRDSKWIYDNCLLNTKVTIYDSSNPGPLGKPTTIKIPAWQNWDPTDPNV